MGSRAELFHEYVDFLSAVGIVDLAISFVLVLSFILLISWHAKRKLTKKKTKAEITFHKDNDGNVIYATVPRSALPLQTGVYKIEDNNDSK